MAKSSSRVLCSGNSKIEKKLRAVRDRRRFMQKNVIVPRSECGENLRIKEDHRLGEEKRKV